jgi:caa(3)-type oxidase subunit IV
MTDAATGHDHAGPNVQVYYRIGGALAVFTAVSFIVNQLEQWGYLPGGVTTAFIIILGVAVVKATLVGLIFMHLKYDWGKVGFMIIPAFILGAMFFAVLMPDMVLAWMN